MANHHRNSSNGGKATVMSIRKPGVPRIEFVREFRPDDRLIV